MTAAARILAKAREAAPKYRSQLEADFALHLEMRLRAGEIAAWKYEPMRLRLADGTFFKPDFMVVRTDGLIEFPETKGYMREAARVRLRVAAAQFPWFQFLLVRRHSFARFEYEEVPS